MKKLLTALKTYFHKEKPKSPLADFSLFENFTEAEMRFCLALMHQRSFKAGEILFEKGYPLELLYFIVDGEVKLSYNGESANDKNLRKGAILGLHENATVRQSSAAAISQINTLAISNRDFHWLLNKSGSIARKLTTNLAKQSDTVHKDKPQDDAK